MLDIEKPEHRPEETKSETTAIKILNRVSLSNSTDKNVFLTAETVKQYGRELLLYIATEIAPESKARILEVEIQ